MSKLKSRGSQRRYGGKTPPGRREAAKRPPKDKDQDTDAH